MNNVSDDKEWGFAASVRGPYVLDNEDYIAAVQRMLKRNHAILQEKRPEVPDLGDNWFRTGPVTQAIDYDLCPADYPESHPLDCQCGGSGVINPRVVPGVYEHAFAWYVSSIDPTAGPPVYVSVNTPPVL